MDRRATRRSPLSPTSPSLDRLLGYLAERTSWYVPEELILVGTATVVGVGTGLGAVAFIELLDAVGQAAAWLQLQLGQAVGLLLAMVGAGLGVGYVIQRWAPEAKGHGVPEVMEAVAIRGGIIRPQVAFLKVLASSLTIGTGGSAGREGPIVQTGAALGSTMGQVLHLSGERIRTLVACGAAAGISATFNAPIAGAIFALEVILNNFTVRYFGMVVISSVAAGVVSRIFLSPNPAFAVPAYPVSHLGEFPIYVVLGVLASFMAVAFIKVLYTFETLFDGWQVPLPVRTATGMLLTGLVGLALPGREVLGSGLHLIGETIAENFDLSLGMMAALLALKLLATGFTLGSGNSGGVFAPSLFMGAVLGGMVGRVAHGLWPTVAVNPGAYAIVGMASVFAGAARAPITAVLIVFEMSNDYKLILPLMLATVIATFLAEALHRESIYTLKLRLKGIRLVGGRDIDVMQAVTVEEVMTRNVDTISVDATLTELSDILTATHHHGLPVVDPEGRLWGIVTITDLDRAIAQGLPRNTRVGEIATPLEKLVVAYPDETIGDALTRMGIRGFGRLPVVSREDRRQLLGLIRRSDIIRAYNIALTRRAELQHRAARARLHNLDGTEFVDMVLEEGDTAVGRSVLEMAPSMPQDAILISIRRHGRVLIPHGNTVFQPGDVVTAFVRSQDVDLLLRCFKEGPPPERCDPGARPAHAPEEAKDPTAA